MKKKLTKRQKKLSKRSKQQSSFNMIGVEGLGKSAFARKNLTEVFVEYSLADAIKAFFDSEEVKK